MFKVWNLGLGVKFLTPLATKCDVFSIIKNLKQKKNCNLKR